MFFSVNFINFISQFHAFFLLVIYVAFELDKSVMLYQAISIRFNFKKLGNKLSRENIF
jgi:hypothetical protein